MSNTVLGNCINLYIKQDDAFNRIAHSTAFSLQIDIKHNQVKSKDDEDDFYNTRLTNIYWQLSGESLVVDNEDVLFDMMVNGEKLRIGYGLINEGQLTPPEYGYVGDCFITNLELEAQTGDKATYKYTLKGCSPLVYGQIGDPSDGDDIIFNDKETPTLEFSEETETYEYQVDSDYVLPSLINPLGLPVKYTITKIQ